MDKNKIEGVLFYPTFLRDFRRASDGDREKNLRTSTGEFVHLRSFALGCMVMLTIAWGGDRDEG